MDLQENFYLIDKTNRVHDVNKKSVSAPKVIAKGHTGLLKFRVCLVYLLLQNFVLWFMDHVNQEKTSILRDEN